ncbi:MAG TPA: acyl-CoA dehydrogenase family protein [Amycolatopsis sp.]|nr:acyl-CoA dehydrogenase family protein [Amycolatopsis sp.]
MAVTADSARDQELLRSSTARFLEASCPLSEVRSLLDDRHGFRPEYFQKGAELGWLALLVPEKHGGGSVSGRPFEDLALVLHERGRMLQPGPVAISNVVACAITEYGSPEQQEAHLSALAAGRSIGTWALTDGGGDWAPRGVAATAVDGGYALTGAKDLVLDAHIADVLLVSSTMSPGDQLAQFLVPTTTPGLTIIPLETLDLTRRLARVEFSEAVVPSVARLGVDSDAVAAIERQLQVAVTLLLAETIGSMDRMFEFTVQYAKDRVAFGRPIGSFQAVKHLLADLSLLLEASKAGVSAAIGAVQDTDTGASEVISLVKAFVSDSAIELAQGCLQVHGGIGYTWEHDMHLYYRRLAGDSALFGDPAWHRERICALHRL